MPVPAQNPPARFMAILCRLLLPLGRGSVAALVADTEITQISQPDFEKLLALAHANHVVVRAFEVFVTLMQLREDARRAAWAQAALDAERERIRHALPFLQAICSAFAEQGLDATVMKSLDHWPDLGSDLDLFSASAPRAVMDLMQRRFDAKLAPRSWGDRLAQKWNFEIPGLPESVEFHIGRLGQTGEQRALASRLAGRARLVTLGEHAFPVPHTSDRLLISTLQRMYRHFYFRLCDVLDSAELVRSGAVDFDDLRRAAATAGIWEGTATYLVIVSDYLRRYGDPGLDLPLAVRSAAQFGGDSVYFAKHFLRVPILPHSAKLYRSQIGGLLRRGELHSSFRLGLLPWLATAAFIEHKRTGSDKGIW